MEDVTMGQRAESPEDVLKLEKVTKSFDGVRALNSVSFSVGKASITAVVGPNGSGKTTLLNVISGLLRPDGGKVILNGEDITFLEPYKIAKRGIGRTFQMIRVFPQISVLDNMLLPLVPEDHEGLSYGLNPFTRHDGRNLEEKARELLSLAELHDKAHEPAGNLSHGQRRLLEILRAVALDAELYLLDEPTAGVFPEIAKRTIGVLKKLRAEKKSILFVEHNMATVQDAADRVIVLHKGEIIADDEPGAALRHPSVMNAYFGGV